MAFPTLAKYLTCDDEMRVDRFGELVHSYHEAIISNLSNLCLNAEVTVLLLDRYWPASDSEAINRMREAAMDLLRGCGEIVRIIREDDTLSFWRPRDRWVPFDVAAWDRFFTNNVKAISNRVELIESRIKNLETTNTELVKLIEIGRINFPIEPVEQDRDNLTSPTQSYNIHLRNLDGVRLRLEAIRLEEFYAERLKKVV